MTNQQFIEKVGSAAVKWYKTYKILPSLTIAQAILESAWGKSGLAKQCHNYFGMKWVKGCGCGYKTYSTKEQRSDGTYYTVNAKFRKYSSLENGIKGYYRFLSYKRYANLKGVTDYKKACELIRKDGWATSLSYTKSLINLIERYKLDSYDKKVIKGKTVIVIAEKLNCRDKASKSGKVIGKFLKNTRLTLLEKTNASWYKVEWVKGKKNVTGYCAAEYLKIT